MSATPTPVGAAEELFASIDWELLRDQKITLVGLLIQQLALASSKEASLSDKELEALDGILVLLDNIQDVAVDQLGYPENMVFATEADEEPDHG